MCGVCGGFDRTIPIRIELISGLTPQHRYIKEKTLDPPSTFITRRPGVASDATRREAFAAKGCSRIPPPLSRNEAPGVVRTSGALSLRTRACYSMATETSGIGSSSSRGHPERYQKGKLVRLQGWPLSLSEVRIYAIVALSKESM